jgi:hypothetical protein
VEILKDLGKTVKNQNCIMKKLRADGYHSVQFLYFRLLSRNYNFTCYLCQCETLFLTLWEEYKLRVGDLKF